MRRLLAMAATAVLAACAQVPPSPQVAAPSGEAPRMVLDADIQSRIARADAARVGRNILRLADFGTRHTCSGHPAPDRGVDAARDFILATFDAIAPGDVRTALDRFTRSTCPGNATYNVVAWLPGTTHPERVIVVGGHYDSRTYDVNDAVSDAPGANDSGSQSALVMEVATLLGARMAGNAGPRAAADGFEDTLMFVTFSAEEQGGGAASLAANIARYVPDAEVVAMLNSDIVGGDNTVNTVDDLRRFRLYAAGAPREVKGPDGTPDNTSPARALMRYVQTWGGAYVPSMKMVPELRQDRPGRGSDHISFLAMGAPAVRFIETVECSSSRPDLSTPYPPAAYPPSCLDNHTAHQHSPFDRFEYVTPEYTTRLAQVVAATAASLARAPAEPRDVRVERTMADGLTLSWHEPATGAPATYVIAARSITENFYRRRVTIDGAATRTMTPADSLGVAPGDSFFVSIAAVDAAGHESLFAFPEWRCDVDACAVPGTALQFKAVR